MGGFVAGNEECIGPSRIIRKGHMESKLCKASVLVVGLIFKKPSLRNSYKLFSLTRGPAAWLAAYRHSDFFSYVRVSVDIFIYELSSYLRSVYADSKKITKTLNGLADDRDIDLKAGPTTYRLLNQNISSCS